MNCKNWLLVGIIMLLYCRLCGQKDTSYIFNEFCISGNVTTLRNDNTENRAGFGLGAYHVFRCEKKFNVIYGLEFNRTGQFKRFIHEGHMSYAHDVTYHLNMLSIGLTGRMNFGKTIKFFIEPGFYLDLNLWSTVHGTSWQMEVLPNNQFTFKETESKGSANISTANYGPSLGIGLKIPVSKLQLIVKTDYKFGLHTLNEENMIFNRFGRIILGIEL